MATSSDRSPAHGGLRAFAMYMYNHHHRLKLLRVNLIDYSGKGRDLRKKPKENGWDPRMFSAIGTMTPNQDLIDWDLKNWKDENTPIWIKIDEYEVRASVATVSHCHAVASYRSVFEGDVRPEFSKYSVTVNLTNRYCPNLNSYAKTGALSHSKLGHYPRIKALGNQLQ